MSVVARGAKVIAVTVTKIVTAEGAREARTR
jgi:hypothetical protein